MSLSSESELARFQLFVADYVAGHNEDLSPEEALDLWRARNPLSDDATSTTSALRDALDDLAAGDRGVLLEEFDEQFQSRNGEGLHSS